MADIIFVLIILICAFIGSKRGFIRSLVGAASTILSLFISMVLYHPVSQKLYNSPFGEKISEGAAKFFEKSSPLGDGDIPPVLSSGLSAFADGAAEAVAMLTTGVASFVLVAVLAKLMIKVLMLLLNITTKLPIIKQANSLLGALVGIISGAILCYVIIGITAALEPSGNLLFLSDMIKKSNASVLFYYDNIITNILASLIK